MDKNSVGRRAGEQGLRPSVGNQAEVKNLLLEQTISHHAPEDFHTHQSGPHIAPSHNCSKASRQEWSRKEYKGVMEAFYTAPLNPKTSITQGTYDILRANNITKRLNLNANKLENFLRDISSSERLTKMELQAIQISVKQKNQNTKPLTRGTSVAPEKQNANKNQENDKNNESDAQEPLNIDTQDKSGNIMKESILQRHEIAKETPISKRLPIPKLKHE